MTFKQLNEVSTQPVQAGQGVTFQVLIGPAEAPNFAMRRFIMEPGGGMPNHTNQVEHEQLVLRGQASQWHRRGGHRGESQGRGLHPGRGAALVSEYRPGTV